MALDLTALGETIRRVYDTKVADGVYSQSPFLDMIEKETVHLQPGESARVNIFKQYGAGESNFAEGDNYNTAGSFGYSTASYNIKNTAFPVKISGSALASTQEGQPTKSAFKAVEEAMKRGVEAIGLANERQLHGFGNSLIAKCGTTTASTTVQLDVNGVDYDGKQAIARGWLAVGKKVDIGTTASEASIVADAVISAVDATNGTITIDNAVTTTSSHYVSIQNSRSGTTSYEMSGLGNIVDSTGTVGGIAYSDGQYWQSAKDSSTTALTLATVRDLERSVRQTVGVSPTAIVVGFKQAAKLQALAETQITWNSIDSVKVGDPFAGKYQIFDGKQILPSHNCHDHRAYLVRVDDFVLVEQNKPSWSFPQVTGQPVFQWDLSSDNLVGAIRHYRELGVRRRCTSGVFTALTA